MAVDSTPATTVKNMLNGIDYSALIGGPLKAAVEAQAIAAKSSWEFIQHVGLRKNKNGETEAINVEFMYQKDGTLAKLIVPLLTIVPIPMIVVDDVSIKFKASLNASASEYSENSSSKALDIGGEGSLTFGKGPVSVDLKIKANYSTKKDSKATQESKYSVEYTQDIEVHAKQADMPAGLATVLNILSSSVTPNGSSHGKIELDKTAIAPTKDSPEIISVTVKDDKGIIVPKAKIKITSEFGKEDNGAKSDHLTILYGHLQKTCDFSTGNAASIELEDGVETLTFKVTGPIPPAIISVTTEGETPTTSKIKVAQYLLAAPSSTALSEAKDSSKETQ